MTSPPPRCICCIFQSLSLCLVLINQSALYHVPRGEKYSAAGATIVSSSKHSLTGKFDLKFLIRVTALEFYRQKEFRPVLDDEQKKTTEEKQNMTPYRQSSLTQSDSINAMFLAQGSAVAC